MGIFCPLYLLCLLFFLLIASTFSQRGKFIKELGFNCLLGTTENSCGFISPQKLLLNLDLQNIHQGELEILSRAVGLGTATGSQEKWENHDYQTGFWEEPRILINSIILYSKAKLVLTLEEESPGEKEQQGRPAEGTGSGTWHCRKRDGSPLCSRGCRSELESRAPHGRGSFTAVPCDL